VDDVVFAQPIDASGSDGWYAAPTTGIDTGPNGELPAGAPVPEPTTMLLVGSGFVGVACTRRRRTRVAAVTSVGVEPS
jgi:hypothetical protein